MKKCCTAAAAAVLTLFVLTGCGCRNSKPLETTMPTTLPPVTTLPMETQTVPTTRPTEPATIPDGNGPISTDTTAETEAPDSRLLPSETGSGITGSITG